MSKDKRESARSRGGLWKKALALVSAAALSIGLVTVTSTAASAAPGITSMRLMLNGDPLASGDEVRQGDRLWLQIVYSPAAEGTTLDVDLGSTGVNIDFAIFPTNIAVESISQTGSVASIKFASPWPGIQDGVLALDLEVDTILTPTPGSVEWSDGVDGQNLSVIFLRDSDQKPNISNARGKAVDTDPAASGAQTNLDSFVTTTATGPVIDPGIMTRDITYTLTVDTPEGTTRPAGFFQIADALPAGFSFSPGPGAALTVNERTWPDGYTASDAPRADFATSANTASGFTGAFANDIVGPSRITMSYTVRVTDTAALQTALQDAFDARAGVPGNYEIPNGNVPTITRNTATFTGMADATTDIRLRGNIAGPCITGCAGGNPFTKSDDLTELAVTTQPDGTIVTPSPLEVNYTLGANLSQWNGTGAFALSGDVIIRDTLGAGGVQWNLPALPATIASPGLNDNAGVAIANLANAGACPATEAIFRAASSPGWYCVDGKTIMINVGTHTGTDVEIVLPALVTNVTGLVPEGSTDHVDRLRVRNTATFYYNTSSHAVNADGHLVIDKYAGNPIDNAAAFDKTAPQTIVNTWRPGDPPVTLEIPYRFTVNSTNTGVPASSSRIVDYIDTRFFDIDASLSNVQVSGTYNRTGGGATVNLNQTPPADFALVWTAPTAPSTIGTLAIELTTEGQQKVSGSAAGRNLEIDLVLTTRELNGKETIDIPNRAEMFGSGPNALYESSFQTRGTSFGAESETRKHVYDQVTPEWTQTLTEDMAVGDEYIYRLQYISHPGFGGIAIPTLHDVLPAGLEFVEFVDDETGANPSAGPVDVSGNLQALFDNSTGPNGRITLQQKPATVFPVNTTAEVFFKARITNVDLAILNEFGMGSTNLVPKGPGIDIQKWNDEGTRPAYNASGAITNDGFPGDHDAAPGKALDRNAPQTINFTISNDGPEPLVDLVVSDQLISGAGTLTGLSCTFPGGATGTRWAGPFAVGTQFDCTAALPGLDLADTHHDRARVDAVGAISGHPVSDEDDWHAFVKSWAVGDYTWIDTNKNGIQDAGEPVLPGVTVDLLDEQGKVIATTTTDENGLYIFDELPPGTYQIRFTLTEEQAKKYRFTKPNTGTVANDSDALVSSDPRVALTRQFVLDSSNAQLTTNYGPGYKATHGIDPTWDAGVWEDPSLLASTGSDRDFVWIGIGAGVLVLLGAGLILVRRRRASVE